MKNLYFMTALILSAFLSACSGLPEKQLALDDVAVYGDEASYIRVVPGTYSLSLCECGGFNPYQLRTSLCVELIKPLETVPRMKIAEYGNFEVALTDGSIPISTSYQDVLMPASSSDYDKLKQLLQSEPGTKVTILLQSKGQEKKPLHKLLEKAAGIEINKASFTQLTGGPGMQSSNSSSENDSNEDWDEILKRYERLAKDYAVVVKKMQNGNKSAISEYNNLLEDVSDLVERIDDAGLSLSENQMNRYAKITAQIASIAQTVVGLELTESDGDLFDTEDNDDDDW